MQLQKKSLYLLFNVIVAICAREPSSPACSKYDYEERLLERVLRNELALETTLKEIKTHAKVENALKRLEDGNSKLESTLEVMEKTQNEKIEKRLSDFINNASNNITSTLANSLNILKDQLKVPTVYFRARITSGTDLSSGQDVVFPTVDINEGRSYDPATGKFTASVSGMYLFSVQYTVYQKKDSALEIVHQDKTIQRSFNYGRSEDWPSMTMQVSASVVIGDKVWVRATHTSKLHTDSNTYTSFSGTLIHV